MRVKNGVLPEIPPAWELAVAAATEALAVARASGIELNVDLATRLREVCTATAANRSSMLQDVLSGRRTEIEALNAQVTARSESHHIPTPVNRTSSANSSGPWRQLRVLRGRGLRGRGPLPPPPHPLPQSL